MRGALNFGLVLLVLPVACRETRPGGTPDVAEPGADSAADASLPPPAKDAGIDRRDASNPYVPPDAAELPPDKAWLLDPDVWKPVEGAEFTQPQCYVFEGVGPKLKFAPLEWTSCGTGCATMELGKGWFADSAFFPTSSIVGSATAAEPLLAIETGLRTASTTYDVLRIVRLRDGVTVAAIQERMKADLQWSYCNHGAGIESVLMAGLSGGGDPANNTGGKRMYARADPAGGPWTWARPPVSNALDYGFGLDIEYGGGTLFAVGAGAVWMLPDPTSTKWTLLESPSGSHEGAGQGDLAVWDDYPGGGVRRVRGWAPAGGIRTIIGSLPEYTCGIDVSPSRIAGLMLLPSVDSFCNGPAKVAHFWTTPRAYAEADVKVSVSPPIPGVPFFAPWFRTWGDHAAAAITPAEYIDDAGGYKTTNWKQSYVLVANLATWKMWRVDAQQGLWLNPHSVALTTTDLYFAEDDGETLEADRVRRMVRYELAKLDSIGKALP